MSPAAAQATQRALDDALQDEIPQPEVIEWWSTPGDDMRNLLARADARRLNRVRTGAPLTGFGELQ